MKTDYHIIWVDDDLESVADDINDTREFFEKFGIEAHIKTYQAIEQPNIHEVIKVDLGNPDLDLIVVDFMMDGMDGRQLINAIRTSDHVFLPVIFYSAAGTEVLHREAAASALDGVYISSRDRVRRKIEEVATSLLRKEQTTKRTRGLLMEGVSEIDANFGLLFHQVWSKLSGEQKDVVIAYLKKRLSDRSAEVAKADEAMPTSQEEFKAMMSEQFVSGRFDTATRWRVIKRMLELLKHDKESTGIFLRLFEYKEVPGPLVPLRNNYGHKTRAELEKDHTEDKCIAIRKELRVQMGNLGKMVKDTKA